ncbi:MAG: N-acetylglucosamine-6-phosphate deacetylase [Saccharospirillum sp.]
MHQALIAPTLFDGYDRAYGVALLVSGETIESVVPLAEIPAHYQRIELKVGHLSAGLIDLQVNGGGGVLWNNQPDREALGRMARGHARAGVARILPTLISDTPDITRQAVQAAIAASDDVHSGVLGVHVEGPFFSHERNGVHHRRVLRPIAASDWDWLEALASVPAMVTLAPEVVPPEAITHMVEMGIRVSAGHTNATHLEVNRAIAAGLSGFTHLFNAMRPISGREPGVVGTALSAGHCWCGIIADGIHVHLENLRLACQAKPRGKLYLVSDAMATVGSEEKRFRLYDEWITEQDGCLVNAEGRLAGSAISLADAVRFCTTELKLPFDEAIAMASRYPAEYLGVEDRFGVLRPGRVADVTWFDDTLQVAGLWRAGRRLY